MFGMIRRYLKGRARIIAKRQLAQGAKKVAQSVKDARLLKTKTKSQILAFIISISLVMPNSINAVVGEIVFDPTSYAKILESIEKYNNMIKTAQDSLDTLNRVNDIMNTASNQLNNLQTGLADPRQLVSRFESNLKGIEDNAKRIAKNLEEKDWANAFHKLEYASCKKKWQNLLKEYKELEKQNAQSSLEEAMSEDDGSEESQQRVDEARQAFNKSHEAKAIERGFKYIDIVDTQGLQAATNQMHEWANAAQKYIDVRNSEYISIEEAMRPKDRYTYQKKLCNMVDEEMAKLKEKEGISCYNQAVKNKDRKAAEVCIKKIKENREISNKNKRTRYETLKNNSNIFGIYNIDTTQPILSVNEQTGALEPSAKYWKEQGFGNADQKENIAQIIDIPQTDDKGNTTTIQKWVAKQDTINALFTNNKIMEALNLQNQRNMALALQGDAKAIQQSQLETLQILGKQIQKLHESLNAIGQIAENLILEEEESFEKNAKERESHDTKDELKKFSIDDEVKHWEYNEYGIPVFKNRNFEKSEGILGL